MILGSEHYMAEQFASEHIIEHMDNDNFPRGWCGLIYRVLGVWLLCKDDRLPYYYVCGAWKTTISRMVTA